MTDKLLGQARCQPLYSRPFGVYLNLVEGLLWEQDVERSNRSIPTDTEHRAPQVLIGQAA